MKIAIAGPPKSGKTTLSNAMDNVMHTDDLIDLDWSALSEAVSYWFDKDSVVVEGVAVPRALRKWLRRNSRNEKKPVDKVIYLSEPFCELTSGQLRIATGALTVMIEIIPELERRGVIVEEV